MDSGGLFRILQMIFAVLGLICALSSYYTYAVLVIFYALAITYLVMIIICELARKSSLGTTAQVVIEVVLGLGILVYTIAIISNTDRYIWSVATIIIGFILPALFFITAYEKS